MLLTSVIQSLLPPEPGQADPWPLVVERINSASRPPDFVLLNECRFWADDDNRLLRRAERDLGLSSLPVAMSASGLATVIMYRSETVGSPIPVTPPTDANPGTLNQDKTGRTYHGWSIAWFDVGLPQPLAVFSFKITPYSIEAGRIEAAYVGSHIYRKGVYALGGGDVNQAPQNPGNPPPDWSTQHPYNVGSRAVPGTARTGNPIPDRTVARQLYDKGLDDVAWEYAQATGDYSVLKYTSEYDRIDTGHVTQPITPAITHCDTLSTPEGASDHDAFEFTFDPALVRTGAEFDWR